MFAYYSNAFRAWFAYYDHPSAPDYGIYDHTDATPNLPDGYNVQEDFFVVGGTVYDVTSAGATDEVWPNEVRNAYVQKGSLQNIFPESSIFRPHIAEFCHLLEEPRVKVTATTGTGGSDQTDGAIYFRSVIFEFIFIVLSTNNDQLILGLSTLEKKTKFVL